MNKTELNIKIAIICNALALFFLVLRVFPKLTIEKIDLVLSSFVFYIQGFCLSYALRQRKIEEFKELCIEQQKVLKSLLESIKKVRRDNGQNNV